MANINYLYSSSWPLLQFEHSLVLKIIYDGLQTTFWEPFACFKRIDKLVPYWASHELEVSCMDNISLSMVKKFLGASHRRENSFVIILENDGTDFLKNGSFFIAKNGRI